MTTFDRHIFRRITVAFVFLVAMLVVFFVVLHYVEFMDDFLDREATVKQVLLEYYPAYIPEIVKLISPLAVFLSCIYVTGKLAQNLELVALKIGGVSLGRLLVPYLLFGVLVTTGMFFFNGWVVPDANKVRIAFEEQYMKGGAGRIDASQIQRQYDRDHVLLVNFFDRRAQTGHGVTILEFDGPLLRSRIDAPRMDWVDSTATWRIDQATLRAFDDAGLEHKTDIAQLDTTLNVHPGNLAQTERDAEMLTIPAAREHIAFLRRSGASQIGKPLVDFYGKFAYPLANLILVLVGVPLASVRRRGGQAIQLGLGLVVAFVYLAFMKILEPFGYSGGLSPLVTAWLPHATFLLFGFVMLGLMRRR